MSKPEGGNCSPIFAGIRYGPWSPGLSPTQMCSLHEKHNCSFRQLRDIYWQERKANSLMLQVGLVDDEKAFKVNDGDDDGDINNDFHFDVNVTTSMTMMTMTTDMTIVFAVMTSQATL